MRNFSIPRRSFLRGLGGVAITLPALEAMTGRAHAADDGPCLRYLYAFAGVSTGRSVSGVPTSVDLLAPEDVGSAYTPDKGLTPLADFGVNSDVSVVSGMLLPWQSGGDPVPSGGRALEWHASSTAPLVSGVRSDPDTEAAQGPSSDIVVAQALGGDTPFESLAYRVQAAYYRGGNGSGGNRGRITYKNNDAGGIDPVDPIVSPRLAYETLFASFIPADPVEQAATLARLRRRTSALDLVKTDTERLVPNLGAADKIRVERHLDEIRALEERLANLEDPTDGACQQFESPGDDPPIGNANGNGNNDEYFTSAGYSNEETRAEVLFDLVHMAFACDLSRSASVMMTMAQCFMNLYPIAGHETDMHQAGHGSHNGQGLEVMTDSIRWHVHHFARLVEKIRDTTDFDGGSMLDNCALILQFEGGHGYDPQTGEDHKPHSSENMSALVAGGAGGLNPTGGKHVVTDGAHPVQVVNAAMQAVGIDQELGEVSGSIPELFV
ncbi:MAG: DUF1552 domain-containing protein [Myxococcota bacterium]